MLNVARKMQAHRRLLHDRPFGMTVIGKIQQRERENPTPDRLLDVLFAHAEDTNREAVELYANRLRAAIPKEMRKRIAVVVREHRASHSLQVLAFYKGDDGDAWYYIQKLEGMMDPWDPSEIVA